MNYEEFKGKIDNELANAKKNKILVTNQQKMSLKLVLMLIVGVLAFQNGLYGFESSSSVIGSVTLAIMFFSGDLALTVLNTLTGNKVSAIASGKIAKVGLILLSITAGLSFLLKEQLANDNVDTSMLKEQIKNEQDLFKKLPSNYVTARNQAASRIQSLQQKYYSIEENQKHASNGIYVYLSNILGYSYESVSLCIKTLWILVFLFTSISLSMYLGALWCDNDDAKFRANYLKKLNKELNFTNKLRIYHNASLGDKTVREIKKIENVGTEKAMHLRKLGVGQLSTIKKLKERKI